MSLTSILTDKRRQDVKRWFKIHFPNPGLPLKPNIIVPDSSDQPYNSGEIGAALDYLVRFTLERINGNLFEGSDWVAKGGLELILTSARESNNPKLLIGSKRRKWVNRFEFIEYLQSQFQLAENNYSKFISDGILTQELILSTILLAKLDIKFRSGITDVDIDELDKDKFKISELQQLFLIVPWEKFIANKHCIANPTFGEGSALVGGADADFIVDNTLIDIKSSKHLKLARKDLSQLIGYHLLALIGGVNGNKYPKIEKVGIYFARYGYLWQISLTDYYSLGDYKLLANRFINLVWGDSLKTDDEKVILKPLNFKSERSKKTLLEKSYYQITKEDFKCPYCESKSFSRHGKSSSGKYKYRCKSCKKNYSTHIKATAPIKSNKNKVNKSIDRFRHF